MKRILLVIGTLTLLVTSKVCAQTLSTGIAKRVSLIDATSFDGAIVCTKTTGFGLCDTPYSTAMFGIVTEHPSAMFENEPTTNGKAVLSDGIAAVRVSDKNGKITKGSFVTSSETPGMGMKATETGYVLGMAINDAQALPTGELMVNVALNIHAEAQLATTRSNLMSVIKQSTKAPMLEPLAAFRYLLAALLVVIAFTLGLIYFGRMANTGVEAIGRNPLAERLIQRNIVLHVLVTLIIIGAGLAVAYIVLIL